MAQRRLPFRRTSFLPRRKGGKERPGLCPWTPENGQRTPACGLQSNPPPCLSWAVRSTIVCAERFLVRPLGMGSGGGGDDDTLVLHSHLTLTGRFRPPLSWPYSVFPPAGGNEPFGLVACAQSSAARRRPRRPKGPEGVFPPQGTTNSPAGIRGYGAFAPSSGRSRGNPLVGSRGKAPGRSLVTFWRIQKVTPRRVGETAWSHQ